MIAILLALARIASDSLEMTFFQGTDPNIAPGRRNCQRANPIQRAGVAHWSGVWPYVAECFPGSDAANSGQSIRDVPKAGNPG